MTAKRKPTKPMKQLPPVPTVMHLPAGPVQVVRQDGLQEKKTAGLFMWAERVIAIDSGLRRTAAHLTLEHEWVHAVLADAGVMVPHKLEEDICNALGSALVFRKRQP